VCGDAWGTKPRVEQAWLSGDALGRELAARLA
jgi:predicted NAD/FAD-dependent oxidoreductase